jgi:hypothetical protein
VAESREQRSSEKTPRQREPSKLQTISSLFWTTLHSHRPLHSLSLYCRYMEDKSGYEAESTVPCRRASYVVLVEICSLTSAAGVNKSTSPHFAPVRAKTLFSHGNASDRRNGQHPVEVGVEVGCVPVSNDEESQSDTNQSSCYIVEDFTLPNGHVIRDLPCYYTVSSL